MVAYNGIEAAQTALTLVAVVAGFVFFDFGLTGTLAVIIANRYVAAAVYLYLLHSTLTERKAGSTGRLRGGCSPTGSAPTSRSSSPT